MFVCRSAVSPCDTGRMAGLEILGRRGRPPLPPQLTRTRSRAPQPSHPPIHPLPPTRLPESARPPARLCLTVPRPETGTHRLRGRRTRTSQRLLRDHFLMLLSLLKLILDALETCIALACIRMCVGAAPGAVWDDLGGV